MLMFIKCNVKFRNSYSRNIVTHAKLLIHALFSRHIEYFVIHKEIELIL